MNRSTRRVRAKHTHRSTSFFKHHAIKHKGGTLTMTIEGDYYGYRRLSYYWKDGADD